MAKNKDIEMQALLHDLPLDQKVLERIDALGASEVAKVNPRFKRSLILAVRTAFCCALASIAEDFMPRRAPANWKGYLPTIIVAIVYTVFDNLATTVMYTWQGLFGTVVALAHTWVLCKVLPDGFVIGGCIDYCVFFAIILWLNLNINVKIFALSWQAYFSMCFCSPTKLSNFMEFTWDSEMSSIFFVQVLGSVLALAAVLFPYPITALGQATTLGAKTAKSTAELMSFVVKYYSGDEESLDINIYNSLIEHLKSEIATMEAATDMAWWEGFDWGRRGKIRQHMVRHLKLLAVLSRRLNIMQSCAIGEDFGRVHKEAMQTIRVPICELVKAVGELLMAATCDAADGYLDEEEKERKRVRLSDVQQRTEELSSSWHTQRSKLSSNMAGLDKKLRTESFFLREVCIISRNVTEFVQDLVDGPDPSKPWIFFDEVKKRFDPAVLLNSTHLSFVWRNWLSCTISFLIGLEFYNFDSSMPGYVTLMLSAKPGAALMGNLSRIQGTVLGMLTGSVLYILLHDCHQWGYRCAFLFVFEILANFVYYYSSQFGSLGGLLAVFGGKLLIASCQSNLTGDELSDRKIGAYHQFHMVAEALVIVMVVDLIFQRKAASEMARERLNEAMEASFGELRTFVEQEGRNQQTNEDLTAVTEKVESLLGRATMFGEEADAEPRLWKAPFRKALHDILCKEVLKIHLDTSLVIRAFMGPAGKGLFHLISKQPSYSRVKQDLLGTMEKAEKFVKDVMDYEDCGLMSKEVLKDIQGLTKVRQLDGHENLIMEVKNELGEIPCPKSMEDCKVARLSVVFDMLDRLTAHIGGLIITTVEKM